MGDTRTSVSDGLPYARFIESVMNDATGELLKNFRRHPDYDLVVPGNRNGSEMFEHLDVLKNRFPWILEHLPRFVQRQGVFGNPKTYVFDISETPIDVPLILQIYYLALTIKEFGDLDGFQICEIGPGAGLQFKLITDLFDDVKYTFVDLEGSLHINRKHVEWLGRERNVEEYIPCFELMDGSHELEFDLLISDCAFNELHRDVQSVYIDKLFNVSRRGRVAFYDSDIKSVIPNMGIDEVMSHVKWESSRKQMDMRVPTLYWNE